MPTDPHNICKELTPEDLEKICKTKVPSNQASVPKIVKIPLTFSVLPQAVRDFSDSLGPAKDLSKKPEHLKDFLGYAALEYEKLLIDDRYDHCCALSDCQIEVKKLGDNRTAVHITHHLSE
jgi:hypothetical protein